MRILHAPIEIAGQVGFQVSGQRELGEHAVGWFEPHPFGYEQGPDLPAWLNGRLRNRLWMPATTPLLARHFDIVHFHGGRSFLPSRLRFKDAAYIAKRMPVLQNFVGSDARLPSHETERNEWYVNAYDENDAVNRDRLARWAPITRGHVVFQDHSLDYVLTEYFEHVHVVPLCVDTRALRPSPPAAGKTPVVVHAPSQRGFKGSDVIAQAVTRLRDRGLDFVYQELHGATHQQVLASMAQADIVIDQLRVGAYGTVSVEAMALGKPTICFLLPDVVATLPSDLPIINASPADIDAVLERWLLDEDARIHVGAASRQFAERVHDNRVVATQLLSLYRQVIADD